MKVLKQLQIFCLDHYGCEPEDVTLSATVRELNLTRDDLDDVAAMLYNQFGVPLSDAVLDEAETVEDLVGYIEDRL